MKLYYNIIAIIFTFIMVMGLASAAQNLELGELPNGIKKDSCVTLKQYCSNCSFVNITSMAFPNGSTIALNYRTEKLGGDTYINNSFCNTSQLGSYVYGTLGDPDGIITNQPVSFVVTPLGNIQSISQGIGGIAPIAIVLFLTFLFGVLTYVFSHNEDYKGLSYLFFGLMAINILVSLHLGYVYTRDVAVLENTSNTMLRIYTIIMYIFVTTLFVGLVFWFLKILTSWKDAIKEKQGNDGWDNNTY